MEISRILAMPNSNTFDIKPIGELIEKYGFVDEPLTFIDPFCRNSKYKKFCISNDIDTDIEAN